MCITVTLTCVLINSLTKCVFQDGFKGALSGRRQIFTIESPLNMMKNVFYFT